MISEQYGPDLNVCATFADEIPEPTSAALPMLVIRQTTPSVQLRDGRIVGSVDATYYRGALYAVLDPAAILERGNSLGRFYELGHERYGRVPSVKSAKRDDGTVCDSASFEFGRGSEPDEMGGYVPERVKLPATLDGVDLVFTHRQALQGLWDAFAEDIAAGNIRPGSLSVSGMTVKADEVREDGTRHIVTKSLVSMTTPVQVGAEIAGNGTTRYGRTVTMREVFGTLSDRTGIFVPALGHVIGFKYEVRSDRAALVTLETVSLPA